MKKLTAQDPEAQSTDIVAENIDQINWSGYISHLERTNRSSEKLVIQVLTVSQAGLILGEKNLREQKVDVQGCLE